MQITFQSRKTIDVTGSGKLGKNTDRHPGDASICSYGPRACLIWEGVLWDGGLVVGM